MNNQVAIAAAVFTGLAAIFAGLSWRAADIADDNMIEHEIYRRQLDFCENFYQRTLAFRVNYSAYIYATRTVWEEEARPDAGGNPQMMKDEAVRRLLATNDDFVALSGDLFAGEMYLPQEIVEHADRVHADLVVLHDALGMAVVEDAEALLGGDRLATNLEAFAEACTAYTRAKQLRLPEMDK